MIKDNKLYFQKQNGTIGRDSVDIKNIEGISEFFEDGKNNILGHSHEEDSGTWLIWLKDNIKPIEMWGERKEYLEDLNWKKNLIL
jgi:hypothetical protein